ncbi:zinc-ribbon domain-containing protein [Gemmatimonadota bacterium]
MIIICHNCSVRYKIRNELVAGGPKRTKCKACGSVMLIVSPEGGAGPDEEVLTRDGSQAVKSGKPPPERVTKVSADPPPAAEAEQETTDSDQGAETSEDTQEVAEEPKESTEETSVEDGESAGEEGETAEEGKPSDTGEEGETAEEGKPSDAEDEDPLAKMEKRRQKMEDEISGRLHKAALETLDLKDLEFLAEKIKMIEGNPNLKPEESEQLFCCIECKTAYSLFPDDARICSNCPGDSPLIRSGDIIRQYSMFRRV